ncbi:hypothetical protein MTO96_047961 [Rhipicephalus appendiculatus]
MLHSTSSGTEVHLMRMHQRRTSSFHSRRGLKLRRSENTVTVAPAAREVVTAVPIVASTLTGLRPAKKTNWTLVLFMDRLSVVRMTSKIGHSGQSSRRLTPFDQRERT